ncbi:MAG: 23S rRNA (pseudouridine(1915)-N(3))-methyltransferase RlmH [Chitinivibrionales bacterium]|nr:23S rRNA (pseudouridine(1915)-N(3))-methyltransferase RlmH [Chitinivibrionales bacterium]
MSFSIDILACGKKTHWMTADIERYVKLIRPFTPLYFTWVKCGATGETHSKKTSATLSQNLVQNAYIAGLSERGTLMNSMQFARWLDEKRGRGKTLLFALGGAYGLPEWIERECNEFVSLSPLTFPHKLAFHVLVEQIYRAFTILHNHPYHK